MDDESDSSMETSHCTHIPIDVDDDSPEFTLAEILEMDSMYKEMKGKPITQVFCEGIAAKFSVSSHRLGKTRITWEKVERWFKDKQTMSVAKKIVPSSSGSGATCSKTAMIKTRTKAATISASEAAELLPNLIFEARSAKDCAWFDVAAFLNYKVLCSGEVFVRVRFAGFGKEEDEWVSLKDAVRERSIPLEHSECERVNVGDLILCYKENEDHALYCDARVLDVERKPHNGNNCACMFLVRYDFTDIEEKVPIGKVCCRPSKSFPIKIEDGEELGSDPDELPTVAAVKSEDESPAESEDSD
ncbi:protein SAWADEE HOMEODOMAIN HOMOLOG 1-like [Andrographis paniculata]|uniref:protein SAWADEE HOMEODOMAIN HOMOLOG 1-like n=1 Tax=Andrographis paniculata TaxID=175694 RepID=UPI0021E98CB1|nr:protein SAWADEE HOMEODOMAIN HOMOLOG 1-like [Andrographis paniculata]